MLFIRMALCRRRLKSLPSQICSLLSLVVLCSSKEGRSEDGAVIAGNELRPGLKLGSGALRGLFLQKHIEE